MTTTTPASVTPILLSATPTPVAGGMSIDLEFNTEMAAGIGTIFVTDGAVQTVIDRATGQPAMRVVGGTDTHAIAAASVSITGTHVKLTVPDLLPGHEYSIVMGTGVLASSAHVAFGGLRSTSQLQFSTAAAPDGEGPALVSGDLDANLLHAGGSLHVTLTFSEPVSGLTADALSAPHATVSALAPSGDGRTWLVTLAPDGAFEQASNVLTIDMSKVHDASGNAGKGSGNVVSYAVDTLAPAGVAIALDGAVLKAGGSVQATFTFSEAVKDLPASAIQTPHAAIGNLATLDGGHTWTGTLTALDPNTSSGNAISVDMSKLQDLNGNAGSGSFVSGASYAIDTAGPTVTGIELDGGLVSSNDSVTVVIRFSEKVSLSGNPIDAPNASLQNLHGSDDGMTWTALLRPGSPANAASNLLSIDMSKVHDAAGNAGSGSVAAPQAYAVDTAGPTATIVLDGADLRYGAGIGVTITLSDSVSHDELLNALTAQNASIEGLSPTDSPLTWTATLAPGAGAAAGTNAVTLDLGRLHDAHGNAGNGGAVSANYLVDTMVAAYVDSGVRVQDGTGAIPDDNVTNNADQYLFGSLSQALEHGQHLQLTIQAGDTEPVEYTLTPDGREWSFQDLQEQGLHLADGVYTLTAQVVDEAGHGSTAASQQITIDTAGPAMLTSPGGASGNPADELVFTFDEAVYSTDREGASMVFTAAGQTVNVYLTEANFSTDHKTITIPANQHHLLAGKAYTMVLSSSITDLAGNPIQDLHPLLFSTSGGDTLAPYATAAAAQTAPGIYGIGAEIDIAVSFSEAVQQAGEITPVLHLNNGGIATWSGTSADRHTVFFKYVVGANDENDTVGLESVGLANNTDLAGHVSDEAGNKLTQAHITFSTLETHGIIQVDAHASPAPARPVLANDTGAIGDGITSAPEFAGGGTASFAKIKLFEGDTLVGETNSDVDGNWTMAGLTLADGMHTLAARQYDSANNESVASATLTIKVDSLAPDKPGTPALAAASDGGLTNDATPTLNGVAAEAGGKIELYVDGGTTALASTDVGAGGAWSLTVADNRALADGAHNLTIKQVDAAGNRSVGSDALAIQVQTTAPATLARAVLDAASDSGYSSSDGVTNVKAPKITGTGAQSGATIKLYDGATLLGTTTAQNDGRWSFTVGSQGGPATLAEGAHTLTASQADAYGNASAASTPLAITIDTIAPTIFATKAETKSSKNWFSLEFSEQVVFNTGAIDVLDSSGHGNSHHASDALTNWLKEENGSHTVLELNLGTLKGLFSLQFESDAIQDLAGNVAIIGSNTLFNIPG